MLRFTRAIHNSRCLLQTASKSKPASLQSESTVPLSSEELIAQSKEKLNAYVTYLKTPKGMKLMKYRPKHAQELLSRDLVDPVTKERVTPTQTPGLPSANQLSIVIRNAETQEQLNEIRSMLTYIHYKLKGTNFIKAQVFNDIGIKSSEFGNMGSFYQWLFVYKKLEKMNKVENLNLFLAFLYLNPYKSYSNTLNIIKKVPKTVESDLITSYLKGSIESKFGKPLTPIDSQTELDLPKAVSNKSIGHQANFFHENEHLYITFKPIAIELAGKLKDDENLKKIVSFVEEYETINKNLEKPNKFEEIKTNAKFFSSKAQPDEAQPEGETKGEPEAKEEA